MDKRDEGCSCSSVISFMVLVLGCILVSKFTTWIEQTPFWAAFSRVFMIILLIGIAVGFIAAIVSWLKTRHEPSPPQAEEDDESWMYRSRPWYY